MKPWLRGVKQTLSGPDLDISKPFDILTLIDA